MKLVYVPNYPKLTAAAAEADLNFFSHTSPDVAESLGATNIRENPRPDAVVDEEGDVELMADWPQHYFELSPAEVAHPMPAVVQPVG